LGPGGSWLCRREKGGWGVWAGCFGEAGPAGWDARGVSFPGDSPGPFGPGSFAGPLGGGVVGKGPGGAKDGVADLRAWSVFFFL